MPAPTIRHSRAITATPAEVHAALTDAGKFQAWWSSWASCAITAMALDAKPGGELRITSRDRDGGEHFVRGRLLHVTSKLIALSWQSDLSKGLASHVFIRLQPADDGATEVSIEHRDIAANEERIVTARLWREVLAALEKGVPGPSAKRVDPLVAAYLEDHPELG
jgi:uncharacterized protein YndB with AHSA1/START domain